MNINGIYYHAQVERCHLQSEEKASIKCLPWMIDTHYYIHCSYYQLSKAFTQILGQNKTTER